MCWNYTILRFSIYVRNLNCNFNLGVISLNSAAIYQMTSREPNLRQDETYLYFVKAKTYLHVSKSASDNIAGYLTINGEYVSDNDKMISFVPESALSSQELSVYDKADLQGNDENDQSSTQGGKKKIIKTPFKTKRLEYLNSGYSFTVSISNLYSVQFRTPLAGCWYGSVVLNTREGEKLPIVFFHDNEAPSTVRIQKKKNQLFDPFGENGDLYWGGQDFLLALKRYAHVQNSSLEPSVYLINPDLNDLRNFSPMKSKTDSKEKGSLIPNFNKLVNNTKWKVLETIASFSTQTRNQVIDIVEEHAPDGIKQIISKPEVQKIGNDFDSARVYLAKWASQVKEEAEISQRKYMLPDDLYKKINHELEGPGNMGLLTDDEIFHASRRNPVTKTEWRSLFDQTGRLKVTVGEIKNRIFHGGLEEDARPEAWLFLLEVYPWDSSTSERDVLHKSYVTAYHELKSKWTLDLTKRDTDFWKNQRQRIEKDINRTDRDIEIFKGSSEANATNEVVSDDELNLDSDIEDPSAVAYINNVHLREMREILLTYNELNEHLGYVQGMSDLLSPLYVTLQDKTITFWAFAKFMERMERNFVRDQSGMRNQMNTLNQLVQFMLPDLFKHLQKCESTDLFFFFRMLLVWFKREFEWNDVLTLWEVLWTDYYSGQFHLFFALAVLSDNERIIIQNLKRFDEVLKYMNDLSGSMNLSLLLIRSELLFLRFKRAIDFVDRKNQQSKSHQHLEGQEQIKISPELRALLSTKPIIQKETPINPGDEYTG